MSIKGTILVILGVAVVFGLGYFVATKNKISTNTTNNTETTTGVQPEKPIPGPTPASNSPEFNKPVTLHLNEKVTFTDGLSVAMTEIDDSRCPAKVQCFWQGEISLALEVSGGKISNGGEVHLGTVTAETANVEGYTFTVKSATASSASIVVTYKNVK